MSPTVPAWVQQGGNVNLAVASAMRGVPDSVSHLNNSGYSYASGGTSTIKPLPVVQKTFTDLAYRRLGLYGYFYYGVGYVRYPKDDTVDIAQSAVASPDDTGVAIPGGTWRVNLNGNFPSKYIPITETFALVDFVDVFNNPPSEQFPAADGSFSLSIGEEHNFEQNAALYPPEQGGIVFAWWNAAGPGEQQRTYVSFAQRFPEDTIETRAVFTMAQEHSQDAYYPGTIIPLPWTVRRVGRDLSIHGHFEVSSGYGHQTGIIPATDSLGRSFRPDYPTDLGTKGAQGFGSANPGGVGGNSGGIAPSGRVDQFGYGNPPTGSVNPYTDQLTKRDFFTFATVMGNGPVSLTGLSPVLPFRNDAVYDQELKKMVGTKVAWPGGGVEDIRRVKGNPAWSALISIAQLGGPRYPGSNGNDADYTLDANGQPIDWHPDPTIYPTAYTGEVGYAQDSLMYYVGTAMAIDHNGGGSGIFVPVYVGRLLASQSTSLFVPPTMAVMIHGTASPHPGPKLTHGEAMTLGDPGGQMLWGYDLGSLSWMSIDHTKTRNVMHV